MRSSPMLNRYGTCEEAEAALIQLAADLSDTFGWFKVTKQASGGFAFRFPTENACVYLDAGIVEEAGIDIYAGEVYSLRCDVFVETNEASKEYIGTCVFDITSKDYYNPWNGDVELINHAFDVANRTC